MEQIVKRAQDCRHTRRDLSVLFQELTQEERFLLEWRIVDGWDYGDIAVRLGIPRADLVKRMHRKDRASAESEGDRSGQDQSYVRQP